MNNKQLNNLVKTAFTHATPDVLDNIMKEAKKGKGKSIDIIEKPKRNKVKATVALAASFAVIICASVFGILTYNNAVYTTVIIDAQPAVSICLNHSDKVVKVVPNNKDGEKLLEKVDEVGKALDESVEIIISSMLDLDYLNSEDNSVLLSVQSENADKSNDKLEVAHDIAKEVFTKKKFDFSLLSQTIDEKTDYEFLSEKFDISIGKACLLKRITENKNAYSSLAKLSINDLSLLINAQEIVLENTNPEGMPSSKSLLKIDKIKDIVLNDLDIVDAEIKEFELSHKDGELTYKVYVKNGDITWAYELIAKSGEILNITKSNGNTNTIIYHRDLGSKNSPSDFVEKYGIDNIISDNNDTDKEENTENDEQSNANTPNKPTEYVESPITDTEPLIFTSDKCLKKDLSQNSVAIVYPQTDTVKSLISTYNNHTVERVESNEDFGGEVALICNAEQYKDFLGESSSVYDEKYFETKALISAKYRLLDSKDSFNIYIMTGVNDKSKLYISSELYLVGGYEIVDRCYLNTLYFEVDKNDIKDIKEIITGE
ncbi:MAG: hypothetical protein KBS62_02250 [Oscillospiraceae bacterium]|nr:hypothetical protein [Candidatus Ruminococcus equi]